MSLEEILAKIDTSGVEREAKKIAGKEPFDVLIVGGGPAGAAAAVYAARKGIRTGIASERFGGQTLDTMGIENFISIKETEGPKFAMALEEHVRNYDVDIMNLQRAAALVPGKDYIEVKLESGASLRSRSVIISTGARWRNINVPGEHEYKNKGVAYCPHCDGPLFKGKRVAVIGGGNSGVEAAIDLAGIVGHVTLVEFDTQLRADAVLQRKLRSLSNVTVRVNAQTIEITGDKQKVNGLTYKDRASGEMEQVPLKASSCRSASSPTPTGSRAPSNCPSTARSSSTRRARLRCRGYSPPATQPPSLSSKSSLRPETGRRQHLVRSSI